MRSPCEEMAETATASFLRETVEFGDDGSPATYPVVECKLVPPPELGFLAQVILA